MIKIVHNKLRRSGFVVHGPHHSRLDGAFASKAQARAWLEARKPG